MDGMNLYKRGPTWWIRFIDHRGIKRRLRGAKNKRAAQTIAVQLQRLIDCASCGQAVPEELAGWVLHKLDQRRVMKIKQWGVVSDVSLSIGQPLDHHLDDWHDGLLNRKRSESYAKLRHNRASKLLTESGANYYGQIDAEQVQAVLSQWQGTLADYTLAHYLSSARSFCRWMTRTGRAGSNPLVILPVSRGEQKNFRRALTDQEQNQIVSGTSSRELLYGMTGPDRSMLYWVALATGLRASAIRRLRVSNVNPQERYLDATGSGARNKTTSPKPLQATLLDALSKYIKGRHPGDPLFDLPHETRLARMLRLDAAACGVSTDMLDFHALRHTFGTTMARNGTHPRTLMSLMDHQTIQMTMRLYTHSFPEDEVAAVNRLPDLGECGAFCAPPMRPKCIPWRPNAPRQKGGWVSTTILNYTYLHSLEGVNYS